MFTCKSNLSDYRTAFVAAAFALGAASTWSAPANALSAEKELLTGGYYQPAPASPLWTSPGFTSALEDNVPAAGLGEKAVDLRMQKGVLSKLMVKVITAFPPLAGSLKVTVTVNGADTSLNCAVAGTGECDSGNKKVNISKDDRLAVRIDSDFVEAGGYSMTYTMVFN